MEARIRLAAVEMPGCGAWKTPSARLGKAVRTATGHHSPFLECQTMETVYVEIRAGEGGEDAKMLVLEQASVYRRYAQRSGL